MNKTFFYLCIMLGLFLAGVPLQAQESREFKWAEPAHYEIVPDTFHTEDALILSREVFFSVEMNPASEGKKITSHLFTHLKIKILTPKGLRSNTQITIPQYGKSEIKTLDARTIKPDGSVKDLNSKDIHELKLDKANGVNNGLQLLRFSIPGAEIGDELELVILQSSNGINAPDEVFLNDQTVYCLHTKYICSLPLGFVADTKCYNNMPRPVIDTVKMQRIMTWQLNKLPPLNVDEGSIPQLEFPFIRFAIRSVPVSYTGSTRNYNFSVDVEPSSWLVYAKNLMKDEALAPDFMRARLSKHFNKLYDDYITYNTNKDTVLKIIRFFNYIHENIHVIDVTAEEFDNSVDYYLGRNEVSESFMFYFFDRMFRDLHLNYFLGLAKNKFTGPFDKDFVSLGMVTDYFMAFEFKDHFYYFFPPGLETHYEFGEVSPNLRGTEALLISKNNNAFPVQIFRFPSLDADQNFSKTNVFLNISLEKGKITRLDKQTLSGTVSTDKRFDLLQARDKDLLAAELNKEERSLESGYELDSVRITKNERISPYLFTLQKNFHSNQSIPQLEKGVYALLLNNMIRHDLILASAEARKTAHYLPYSYTDNMRIYLVFDKKIELVNTDQLQSEWRGKTGFYSLKASQLNETTILLDSGYGISSLEIPPEDCGQIKTLNAEAAKAASLQVIVRDKQ